MQLSEEAKAAQEQTKALEDDRDKLTTLNDKLKVCVCLGITLPHSVCS